MNLNAIKQSVTRSVSRSGLILKKYSPEILTTVGIASGVASGVLAVKATLDAQPIFEKTRDDMSKVHELKEMDGYENQKEYARDVTIVYTRSSVELIKLYWPSFTLAGASIACIIGAHGIMRKRNAALVVAYNAVEKTFSEYRSRVVEELGEDKERDIRLGIKAEEVVSEETGEKKLVHTFDPNGISQYAKFFDECSTQWQRNPEYNLLFLRAQQNFANDRLLSEGHLFLNDVYEALGLPHTKQGAVVGWVLSKDGDNFVDFGIYDVHSDKAREFVNGFEKSILLDFNVDGYILDHI